MRSLIFHVDVNSAFLSWESAKRLRDNPDALDLRTINAVIGGDEKMRHGVVLAKSPSAKKYGIMTGEPLSHARQKCPELVVVPPDHELYAASSRKFIEILEEVAPVIEQCSIDEAFCDMTGTEKLYGDPIAFATKLKDRIYKELGFTVNIGISTNKLLAKMASDFEKPNKVHTLFPKEIPVKMWPLPISELYMAGRSSVEVLNKLEIRTIGELAKADPNLLELHLKSHGRTLWEFANGIDHEKVRRGHVENKGIGNSTTLAKDAVTEEEAKKVLLWLAESVGGRLRKEKQRAGMVSVEIKYHTFQTVSHQKQLETASNADQVIYKAACELFRELWNQEPIRLLGIRTSKLQDESAPVQMSIFDFQTKQEEQSVKNQKHQKLDKALDVIRKKYGEDAVKKGTLLK